MTSARQEFEQYFELPNITKTQFRAGLGVAIGCEDRAEITTQIERVLEGGEGADGTRCCEETVIVLLFDIKPEYSVSGEPNDISINLCETHRNSRGFDNMLFHDKEVVLGSARIIDAVDYVAGSLELAKPYLPLE